MRFPTKRFIASLVAIVGAVYLVEGCRGEPDRAFFDDTPDGSGADAPSGVGVGTGGGTGGDGSSGGIGPGDDDGASDAPIETGPGPDGAPPDSGPDAAPDSGPDAAPDSGPDAAPDAGPDSSTGCGPTITPTNCSACGAACDTTTTTVAPACNGTTCLYACMPNRQNCNATPPDTNGCECIGTSCCGTSCQTAHSNGVGGTFYDCVPQGTYTQAQAFAACTSYTGNAAQCAVYGCTANAGSLVCTPGAAPNCVCWKYDPGNSGVNGKVSTTCTCPISAGATSWN